MRTKPAAASAQCRTGARERPKPGSFPLGAGREGDGHPCPGRGCRSPVCTGQLHTHPGDSTHGLVRPICVHSVLKAHSMLGPWVLTPCSACPGTLRALGRHPWNSGKWKGDWKERPSPLLSSQKNYVSICSCMGLTVFFFSLAYKNMFKSALHRASRHAQCRLNS